MGDKGFLLIMMIVLLGFLSVMFISFGDDIISENYSTGDLTNTDNIDDVAVGNT